MTTPVLQKEEVSEKIAMTAPVLQKEDPEAQQFTIGFVMPAEYSLDTIPTPNNPEVTLKEIPERTQGVITFSGLWTDAKAKRYTVALLNALEEDGYTIVSDPEFARYDPPWTPPWMRQNEIWVEVE